jgi:DNA-binding transcriptional regulator YdaS (Cro superfamily)
MSKFRVWLYDNGLFIKEFADLLKLDRSSFFNWMKGRKRPGAKSMQKIRMATKGKVCNPEDLLDETTP